MVLLGKLQMYTCSFNWENYEMRESGIWIGDHKDFYQRFLLALKKTK